MEQYKDRILMLLCMFYITCCVVCNPLFFRYLELPILKISSAAFIYPLVYVLIDTISAMTNRGTAIFVIIVGRICDGVFSYLLFFFANQQIPLDMSSAAIQNTNAVNVLGNLVWPLWYHGVIASTVTAIVELMLFMFIFKKLKNFFLSTIISITVTLVTHNLINDYGVLKNDPHVWHVIVGNLSVNLSIMVLYTAVIALMMKMKLRKYSK